MKITRTAIERLEAPEKGYRLYWSDDMPGLGMRVTASGVKSYIVQKRINGKDKRITLGRYPVILPDQAKKEAVKVLAEIASGGDPVASKQRKRAKKTSLRGAFEAYVEARKTLKSQTIRDMGIAFEGPLGDWMDKPLENITRDMVARRHKQLGSRSPARANLTMRYLRAVFNFAIGEFTDSSGKPVISDNPVSRLSQTRAWYRVERRQTLIKKHELKGWMEAVAALESAVARDYLMLVLLTGLRRSEALKLRWDDVDFKERSITIKDTKNHRPHTLPLSDYLVSLLEDRYQTRVNQWVFPAHTKKGHYQGPTQAIRKVTALSGVTFCIHDLRRTFATAAESLDIPAYALKALLNHKSGGDVTAGYLVIDVERLRGPMQKITDFFLKAGGIRESAQVVLLPSAREK